MSIFLCESAGPLAYFSTFELALASWKLAFDPIKGITIEKSEMDWMNQWNIKSLYSYELVGFITECDSIPKSQPWWKINNEPYKWWVNNE